MSLIHCPNCKHEISSKSIKCPYCGYQITKEPNYFLEWPYDLFILTILGIFTVIIPSIFLPYFQSIFQSIFFVILIFIALLVIIWGGKLIYKKQRSSWDIRSSKIQKINRNNLLEEEKYYYKGKTNQQFHQYNKALQCYSKALELNPDFEPALKAKEEVLKLIDN